MELNPTPTGKPTPSKEIKIVKVPSNKNYIIGQIYNLSGEVTALRIIIRKRDARKIELDRELQRLEAERDQSEGQSSYELKKKIKEVIKKIDENDAELEKSTDMLKNKEELCQMYQEELDDAVEYEFPQKE